MPRSDALEQAGIDPEYPGGRFNMRPAIALWIVLLRNDGAEVRYLVVVLPSGTISGALRVPFLPFESLFLRPGR